MNGTTLSKTELAAWRSLLARPDGKGLLFSAGIYLLASLAFPFASITALCGLFIAACIVLLLTRTHSFPTLLAPGIPALVLFTFSGSVSLPAVFFAIIFGGAAGAILLSSARNVRDVLPMLALPPLSFFAAWLISGNPLIGLLTLIPLPVALVGTFCVRRCKSFCGAIAAIGATLLAVLLAVLLITIAAINPANLDLAAHLPELISLLEETVLKAVNEMAALYPEMAITTVFTPTMIHNMIALMINLSPGIITALTLIVAYFVWRMLCTLLVALGMLPRLPRVFVTPLPSPVSAILFILAFLVSFFAGSAYTQVGAVAENFTLILTPLFSLIGFGVFFSRQTKRSCLSVLLLIGLAYLLFNNPPLALTLAALYGAIHSLIVTHRGAKNTNSKGEP
ncbi:MAG: hypothetical protein IJC99_06180 [Clostridia bacterium]|nr:hypothetical protein [Clostridia bacterium]